MVWRRGGWIFLFGFVLVGCGDSIQQKTYPVTGEVRWNGKPAKRITVVLRPVDKSLRRSRTRTANSPFARTPPTTAPLLGNISSGSRSWTRSPTRETIKSSGNSTLPDFQPNTPIRRNPDFVQRWIPSQRSCRRLNSQTESFFVSFLGFWG
jgi:hypothetical protein